MGSRRQHTHDTFGIVEERKESSCEEGNGQVVRASFFVLHAQLPTVDVFHSDLFAWFELKCDGALRSLVKGRKSNKLVKRSVSRVLSVIM